jgi:formiminotetrahydrofolate cyclodeaminase
MDYRHETLLKYLADAAAPRPTPGGGSAAAVAAALATTMASMAAGYTVGKERFKAVEAEASEIQLRLEALRGRLLDLAADDARAYETLRIARRLPGESADEQAAREGTLRDAMSRSLAVCEAVLDAAVETLEAARRLADIGNPNLASDVGVAAELALGAARAAGMNVAANLAGYADASAAMAVRGRTDERLARAERLAAETRDAVLARLRR